MQNAIEIDSLRSIDNYPVVCITGGEPGIMENKVLETIAELRANNPDVKIYMYSAWYKNRWGHRLLDHLDGVHYTLHKGTTSEDIRDFQEFQMHAACCWPGKSYRLYIHQSIREGLTIYPSVWHRLEVKPWVAEEDCDLPDTEDLFILKG